MDAEPIVLFIAILAITVAALAIYHVLAAAYARRAPPPSYALVLKYRLYAARRGSSVVVNATDYTCAPVSIPVTLFIVEPDGSMRATSSTTPFVVPYEQGAWFIPVCNACRTVSVVSGSYYVKYFSPYGLEKRGSPLHEVSGGLVILLRPSEEASISGHPVEPPVCIFHAPRIYSCNATMCKVRY